MAMLCIHFMSEQMGLGYSSVNMKNNLENYMLNSQVLLGTKLFCVSW